MPFCQGLLKLVRFDVMSKLLTISTTSLLKFAPRSKIRYFGVKSDGKRNVALEKIVKLETGTSPLCPNEGKLRTVSMKGFTPSDCR